MRRWVWEHFATILGASIIKDGFGVTSKRNFCIIYKFTEVIFSLLTSRAKINPEINLEERS